MNASSSGLVSVGGAIDLSLRYWRAMVASVTVCVAAAIIYILTATPMYRAELVLSPVRQQEPSTILAQLGGLASLAGINLGATPNSQNALAVLTSRAFLRGFIQQHDLVGLLVPERVVDLQKAESADANTAAALKTRILNEAVDTFLSDILIVQPDAKTGLVYLYVDWSDPEIAAVWANWLVAEVNVFLRQKDLGQAEQNVKYLTSQLEQTTLLGMQNAISRLIENEMNTVMLASARVDYSFEVIDPAIRPLVRHSPRTVLVIALATLLGLLIGLAVASLLDARARAR